MRKADLKSGGVISSSVMSAVLAATSALSMSEARAAGYEKTLVFSGKHSGIAGAGAASVRGSEGLYFNPAGLGGKLDPTDTNRNDATLSVSPTPNWVKAPVVSNDTTATSHRFAPLFGLTANYRVNDRWAIGAGAYTLGGSMSAYSDLDYSSINPGFAGIRPETRGDLMVVEFSLGSSYEIFQGFRLGAAWRYSDVKGKLYGQTVTAGSLLDLRIDDLKANEAYGFRFGAQYESDDKVWGLGLMWRTPLTFTAKGTSSGRFILPAGPIDGAITGGDATAKSSLPSHITFGGFYAIPETKWTVHAEYGWTEYRINRQLELGGVITLPGGAGTVDLANAPVPQHWKNQHVVRLGGEFRRSEDLVIRGGYSWTSEVTPKQFASAVFPPPGPSHSVVVGFGKTLVSKKWDINFATEWNFGGTKVEASDGPAATTKTGEYDFDILSFHTGATYYF